MTLKRQGYDAERQSYGVGDIQSRVWEDRFLPGSRGAAKPPNPLRTGLAPFNASGSSGQITGDFHVLVDGNKNVEALSFHRYPFPLEL